MARLFPHIAQRLAGAQVRGSGCLPVPAPRIYCANHTSHLDVVLVLAALPRALRSHTRPVAASDYWTAGPLRRYLTRRVFRSVLIQRDPGCLNPLGPVFDALREGSSLIYFPEGTRGPGGGLQPLKPGIFYIARAFPQVDIVPVWIGQAHRVLPKGSLVPMPAACSVTFGEALRWAGEEDEKAFVERLRGAMERLR